PWGGPRGRPAPGAESPEAVRSPTTRSSGRLRRRAADGLRGPVLQARRETLTRVRRALRRVLGDLLAALDRLAGGLLDRVDHPVGRLAHLLVLDPGRRQ